MGTEFNPADYEKRPARCPLPNVDLFSTPEGWRCECGKAYRRVVVSQHGDTWRQWQRMPEADGPAPSKSSHGYIGSGGLDHE